MERNKAQARRKLLKTAATSSGVVATVATLPITWTKPLLNSVVSPAHAQMSEEEEMQPIRGVFRALDLQGAGQAIQAMNKLRHRGPQFTLLNLLIPAAHANTSIASDFCGNLDNNGRPTTSFNLIIRINEDETVDFAVDGTFIVDNTDEFLICGGEKVSSIVDTAIADASINIGNNDNDDCFIDLSGITASASQVTGTWTFNFADNNTDSIALPCSGSFIAEAGGVFPTVSSCAGLDIISN